MIFGRVGVGETQVKFESGPPGGFLRYCSLSCSLCVCRPEYDVGICGWILMIFGVCRGLLLAYQGNAVGGGAKFEVKSLLNSPWGQKVNFRFGPPKLLFLLEGSIIVSYLSRI